LVRRRERAVRYPKCWTRLCPTAISGNQWQSVALSGNQWQSENSSTYTASWLAADS
jgi:hypothetical protein